MTQTPTHVSLLQKFLRYFELVAAVGMTIPEPHVAKISALIEAISLEIEQFTKKEEPPAPVVPVAHDDGPKPIV